MLMNFDSLTFIKWSSFFFTGWIVKMEVENPSELDELMDEKAYEEFLENID